MTTPKVKCKKCGYEGEYNSEIFGGLFQDWATIEFHKLQKNEFDKIESNKIKVVLCALWDNQLHPEAQEIINKFKEEIDERNL